LLKTWVKVPVLAGLQVLAVKLVVLLGNKVVLVMTKESQPNWLVSVCVKVPTLAGLHVVAVRLVVLLGDKIVFVIINESQPSTPTSRFCVLPTWFGSQLVSAKIVVSTAAASKVTMVTTVESQPNWFNKFWVNVPVLAGLQVLAVRLVVLAGRKIVVVMTVESQPNWLVRI